MIKKLQDNFTTPEQSKRLLELGVPADSADLYATLGFENLAWIRNTKNELSEDFFDALINGKSARIPIWSVGRLIKIIGICHQPIPTEMRIATSNIIEYLLDIFDTIADGSGFDFSKLEE